MAAQVLSHSSWSLQAGTIVIAGNVQAYGHTCTFLCGHCLRVSYRHCLGGFKGAVSLVYGMVQGRRQSSLWHGSRTASVHCKTWFKDGVSLVYDVQFKGGVSLVNK